jgi:hypothetical protein
MEILYPRCAGLDVHKDSVVARIRCVSEPVHDEVKTFATTTSALLELNEFLSAQGVTHVAKISVPATSPAATARRSSCAWFDASMIWAARSNWSPRLPDKRRETGNLRTKT